MKGVIVLLSFGLFLAALNGCYTIVSNSNNVNGDVTNITVINYPPPQPPPVIDPIIIIHPTPPPNPPYKERPVVTRPPKDRPKWTPTYGNRDPIRGHGNRGGIEKTNNTTKREINNSGSRR